MKRTFLLAGILIGTIVASAISSRNNMVRTAADDFPRGALLFVQTDNLSSLIKLWNESAIKDKYLASQNFAEFKDRHLGLKLASRWTEFGDAAGFPIDLEAVSGLAHTQAAAAIYDIGKLEFVFISQLGDELFAATMLMQNSERFEAEEIAGGSTIYRVAVAADRGRQKQDLLFTHLKGRLIVATSEPLLARTISNVTGRAVKDRLSGDAAFRALWKTAGSRTLTVWLNQSALNNDYYFKRYWLMGEVDELKNIEAVVCDFSVEEHRLVERRKILLKDGPNSAAADAAGFTPAPVPENIPFYRRQRANAGNVGKAVDQVLGLSRVEAATKRTPRRFDYSYDRFEESSPDDDFNYLGSDFDAAIDETPDDDLPRVAAPSFDIAGALASANPQNVITLARPVNLPMPLFVEFRRGVVFHLGSPGRFDRDGFERSVIGALRDQLTIGRFDNAMKWKTKVEDKRLRAQFDLPMLGRSVFYALQGNKLYLANDEKFLDEIMAGNSTEASGKISGQQSERLTDEIVLLVPDSETTYNDVFGKLGQEKGSSTFFTGNIKSLIETFSGVKKAEFRRSQTGRLVHEETVLSFN